jgi:replication initiation protein RepC
MAIALNNSQPGLKISNLLSRLDEEEISLELIRSACPALHEFIPGVLASWDTFTRDMANICALCSADISVFFRARAKLGRDVAAAALVVTFQKCIAGLVSKPTAYLLELVRRGEAGTLAISRSLRALARANMENP